MSMQGALTANGPQLHSMFVKTAKCWWHLTRLRADFAFILKTSANIFPLDILYSLMFHLQCIMHKDFEYIYKMQFRAPDREFNAHTPCAHYIAALLLFMYFVGIQRRGCELVNIIQVKNRIAEQILNSPYKSALSSTYVLIRSMK